MDYQTNPMRGIRGAITVERDNANEIAAATLLLFETMMEKNQLEPDDVTAVFITVTHDLKSAFPARSIRKIPFSSLNVCSRDSRRGCYKTLYSFDDDRILPECQPRCHSSCLFGGDSKTTDGFKRRK